MGWQDAPVVGNSAQPAWASAPLVGASGKPSEPAATSKWSSVVPGLVRGVQSVVEGANEFAGKLGFYDPTAESGENPVSLQQMMAEAGQGRADFRKRYAGDKGALAGEMAGSIAATLPLAFVPGGQGMMARTAIGAATGAGAGVLQPVENARDMTLSDLVTGEKPVDYWTEKAKQAFSGAVIGGAAAPLFGAIGRVIQPQTREPVKTLLAAGVTPTPGQVLGGVAQRTEEKLTSVPILGDAIKSAQRSGIDDLNRAVYAKALEPIGAKPSGELGRKGVEDVADKLGAAYDNLLPKVNFRKDARFDADVSKLRAMVQNIPDQQARQFESIYQTQVAGKLTPGGTMDGVTLKGVESELGRIAKGYRGDASFDSRQLGAAVEELQRSLRENLIRSNPAQAKELAAINSGYAVYARLRDAAGRLGAHDGVFTAAQLQSAVKSGDKSVGKGNFAKGNALMQGLSDAGVNVLGSKYPDSGTTGRMLLAALGYGGAGYAVNPAIPIAAGAATLPYLPGVRNALVASMTKRPAVAAPIADVVNRLALPATVATVPLVQNALYGR